MKPYVLFAEMPSSSRRATTLSRRRRKRPPRSLRKFFRREKARIRHQSLDPREVEARIRQLRKKHWPSV